MRPRRDHAGHVVDVAEDRLAQLLVVGRAHREHDVDVARDGLHLLDEGQRRELRGDRPPTRPRRCARRRARRCCRPIALRSICAPKPVMTPRCCSCCTRLCAAVREMWTRSASVRTDSRPSRLSSATMRRSMLSSASLRCGVCWVIVVLVAHAQRSGCDVSCVGARRASGRAGRRGGAAARRPRCRGASRRRRARPAAST